MTFQARAKGSGPSGLSSDRASPPWYVAHRYVHDPGRIAGLVDGKDVRVVYLGGRPHLVKQPGPEGGVQGQFRRKDLDRHLTVQTLVLGQADDGHVTLADMPLQPVTGDLARHSRARQDQVRAAAHGHTAGQHAIRDRPAPAVPTRLARH